MLGLLGALSLQQGGQTLLEGWHEVFGLRLRDSFIDVFSQFDDQVLQPLGREIGSSFAKQAVNHAKAYGVESPHYERQQRIVVLVEVRKALHRRRLADFLPCHCCYSADLRDAGKGKLRL
ncbi:hypothetical protein D9M69_358760 [compost metagenome]